MAMLNVRYVPLVHIRTMVEVPDVSFLLAGHIYRALLMFQSAIKSRENEEYHHTVRKHLAA